MRIACPSCAAEYDVPASRLSPGKVVRCVQCGGEWIAVRETEEADPPVEPEAAYPVPAVSPVPEADPGMTMPTVSAMDRLAAHPQPRRASPGLAIAWVLTFVVLGCAAAAAVVWRSDVVSVWPASVRVLGEGGTAR